MQLKVKNNQSAKIVVARDLAKAFNVRMPQAKAWVNDGALPPRFTAILMERYGKNIDLYFDVA